MSGLHLTAACDDLAHDECPFGFFAYSMSDFCDCFCHEEED